MSPLRIFYVPLFTALLLRPSSTLICCDTHSFFSLSVASPMLPFGFISHCWSFPATLSVAPHHPRRAPASSCLYLASGSPRDLLVFSSLAIPNLMSSPFGQSFHSLSKHPGFLSSAEELKASMWNSPGPLQCSPPFSANLHLLIDFNHTRLKTTWPLIPWPLELTCPLDN